MFCSGFSLDYEEPKEKATHQEEDGFHQIPMDEITYSE